MARECVEWGEKKRRSHPKSGVMVEECEGDNPFQQLSRVYCVEDDEFIANGMRLIESSSVDALRCVLNEFANSMSEATEKTIARYRLGRVDGLSIGYACKKAVDELNGLLAQVLELAGDEGNGETGDVAKAALFVYMGIGTAANMVCSRVNEIISKGKNR